MMKNYCVFCDAETVYTIKEHMVETNIKEVKVKYLSRIPTCSECGEEIYVTNIDDENIESANTQYRLLVGLITRTEIEKILKQYNIGKKPLAKLLGWGEVTIVRYLEGKMPTREYSDKLLSLNNPMEMLKIYNSRKNFITETAQKKLKLKLDILLGIDNNVDTEVTYITIANYFVNKIDNDNGICITPLKLQKLVYYAQAWCMAFLETPLFKRDICAWVHGPVIDALYYKYQHYGYKNIEKIDELDFNILNSNQLDILENVWRVYGKFEAKYLEELTHHELPWNHARKGYDENERCNEVICKETIRNYYSDIKETHNIKSTDDLETYVRSLNINWSKSDTKKN